MATWRDGPRYAPQERPQAFAEPASGISLAAEPAPALPPEPPVTGPLEYTATAGIPLDQVSSSTVATRDPSLAFSVVASSLTSVESAGREDRDPTQPFAIVASMPTNNKPAAAYPAPSGPPVAQPRPVAAKDLFTAAYIPLLIILAVGILLKPLSILALLAATFIPALRVSFRGRQLRVVGYILVGVVLVTWGVFWFANQGINNLDLQVTVVGQVLCAVYLFADLVLQYLGLRNGEKPSSGA